MLAIVGATGAVGTVMRDIVSTRDDVWGEVRLIASARSAGRTLRVRGEDVVVQELSADVFDGVDLAMFDVPDEVSADWAPVAASRGVVVIDKSGAFRMDPEVPLVVPEVNPEAASEPAARHHRRPQLHHPGGDRRARRAAPRLRPARADRRLLPGRLRAPARPASTRSTTSSAKVGGQRNLGQRAGDVRAAVSDLGPFPAPLAMNVVPWAGSLRDEGWSSEELKIRNETRKILGLPDLRVSATCVRVPVMVGHSLALHAVFDTEVTRADAQRVLSEAPGVVLIDDPAAGEFPTPADIAGTDPTWVGRVRQSQDDPRALELFVCGDNLRKGAALNAAQIAELLVPEFAARAASAPAS